MSNNVAEPKPKAGILRKMLMMALVVTGVGVGAFLWGRLGVPPTKTAAQPKPEDVKGMVPVSTGSSSNRPVALIYGNMAISREELGEYLIKRFGKDRIDALVNRTILRIALARFKIVVSDAEVQAQVQDDLKAVGPTITERQFENQILKKFNKTMYEWKEDHIRPRIALGKLVKAMDLAKVEDRELHDAFEARFGPKVKCRMIVLPKSEAPNLQKIWKEVCQSDQAFAERAKKQFNETLAIKGGYIEIHKHFADANVERIAFNLHKNDVSEVIDIPDGTYVIIKCDDHVAADLRTNFEKERDALYKDILQFKINQKIPEVFAQLRREAEPNLIILHEAEQDDFEQLVQNLPGPRELPPTLGPVPTADLPTPPPGSFKAENAPIVETRPVTPPGSYKLPEGPPSTSPNQITPVSSNITPGTPPTASLLPPVTRPVKNELQLPPSVWKPAP